ncbi:unnamed protein product, partial [Symbiodinium necroappetens]
MSREWADQEKEHLKTSKMYELPFVVPLPNKREETVLDGIAFMITQIQALGYCVTRLHSDRGREFCNKRLRSFLRHRGIFKTTSEGGHYQQNGRVEGMINRIKRQARVLMTAASVEHRYWPFALQHVAARMRLMITTTLLTEVMHPTEPVPSEKGDMQPLHRDLPIDERPVPIISHRIPTKRTVRMVREVSPVLQEEDAEALRLARNPGTSLQELRDHVLGSRWMRTARPRSRGEVFQGGHTHTLGFFRHGGVLGITAECRLFPGFVALLSRLVKECAPEARWTTLALLVDVDSAVHRDKNNLPGYNNVLVPLCIPKVGGGVWCQAEKGEDQRCLNNGKMIAGELWPLQVLVPFELDPRKFHASQTWSEGSRVVLVAYSLTAIQRAEQNTVWRLRQAGFQLPREAPSEVKQDCGCVEREPTVQVEELGAAAPLEKGCPRVAKLDTNDRADVAVPTPVWRQRFTVLDDAQAERARRQGVMRPRSEWREIRVGPHYGDLNHVRDRPLSAFALSMYLARNRSWEETPLLEVIWGGYENPVPWLFGFQPYGLTERNTQFELDRLGEVHSMVRIGYEDAPNLHGYLFRASFGDEEPKWYFIESMMTLEDRFLSAEAVGRDPIPNPQHHPGHPPRVPRSESQGFVEGRVHQGIRMSHRGESDFAREVEQAEAERQLAKERETEGDASEEEGRSDDDVVAGDWEDLEGERIEEGAHFFEEEYEGLQRAVKPLSEATLEQWRREGTPCEVIPAKVICSIKAPKGRRKVRCVCCGNFARSDRWSRADTYSGGIDAVTLRTLLRFAGLRRLDLGIIDVKQAFLSAPLLSNGVQIVVMTPAMFRRHGICEEKYWSVHQALYGLTISPRSWSVHRDGTLSELRFDIDGAPVRICPMTSDPNIWTVYREEDNSVVVYLALYVDDMLAVGETSHVSQTLDKLCQVWKCTEPALLSETGSVTFNGFEVSSGLD